MTTKPRVRYTCPKCGHQWDSVRYGYAFCRECGVCVGEREHGQLIDHAAKHDADLRKLRERQKLSPSK